MPTRLLLVRHGQTDWSLEDRFTGSSDVPLNETGRAQAQALARRLARRQQTQANQVQSGSAAESGARPITAIYSSPMERSFETARIVAEPLQLPVQIVDDLRELDYGVWEGTLREEVMARYAGEFESWRKDPALAAPSAGETGLGVVARAIPAMSRLIASHPGETIAVVAHKTVNRLLICSWLNLPLKHYRRLIGQEVACLNIVDFVSDDVVSLVKLNDTGHMEKE